MLSPSKGSIQVDSYDFEVNVLRHICRNNPACSSFFPLMLAKTNDMTKAVSKLSSNDKTIVRVLIISKYKRFQFPSGPKTKYLPYITLTTALISGRK